MPPTADPRRLWAQAQRSVGVEISAVRAALLRVVRDLDFDIDSEQFAAVRASRGSQLGGASLSPSRVPTSLQLTFAPVEKTTNVSVLIEDRWKVVGRQGAAGAAYQRVFSDVLGAIDAALTRLDPVAAATFSEWIQQTGDVGSSAAVVHRAGRIEATLRRKSARLLDGKPARGPGQLGRGQASGSAEPTGSNALDNAQVAITAPDKVARLPLTSAFVMLTAGQLIAARPGKLPPAMAAQVQDVVISLEQRLDTTAMPQPFAQVSITTEQVPVVTFLRQQARLRDELPLRTLQVCTTCKLEKVINPDFVQMKERSRRMKVLTGSFGAVIGAHQISPYVLVGKLVSIKNSDPDFVCQRCQGLDADETIITFCPQCGERRPESVLRECPRCKLDYRTLLSPEKIWADIDVAEPLAVGAQWTPPALPGQWTPVSVARPMDPGRGGRPMDPATGGEIRRGRCGGRRDNARRLVRGLLRPARIPLLGRSDLDVARQRRRCGDDRRLTLDRADT